MSHAADVAAVMMRHAAFCRCLFAATLFAKEEEMSRRHTLDYSARRRH